MLLFRSDKEVEYKYGPHSIKLNLFAFPITIEQTRAEKGVIRKPGWYHKKEYSRSLLTGRENEEATATLPLQIEKRH